MLRWVFGNRDRTRRRAHRPRTTAEKPPYEMAREIAASGDERARADLARHEDLEPEILYYFASDRSVDVRREVAANPGTPLQADKILSHDDDDEVRVEIARKIGRLVPQLDAKESRRLTELALEVLTVLAEDNLPRVRATIAEEIKLAQNVPRHVVTRLARDVEEIVAAPIFEY